MTKDQEELRIERIAIMAVEGVPIVEATKYCDDNPRVYGYPEKTEVQEKLI